MNRCEEIISEIRAELEMIRKALERARKILEESPSVPSAGQEGKP